MSVCFPNRGTAWEMLRKEMMEMRSSDIQWRNGRASLLVYYGGAEALQVAQEAYLMFMSENALSPNAFPSLAKMESDVIESSLDLFHAGACAAGSLTSGGTESIILAVKSARDLWDRERGRDTGIPEILLPRTAHPAFDKAAHYLGLHTVRVPVGADYCADISALEQAITANTMMVVASAPSLPYGIIDPVAKIAELARARGLWLHVDACIGGYLAPFVKELGYPVPDFDFSVPGVRSLSADLHKYGFAPKGASVILYADKKAHHSQFTEFSDWPKGRYFTPTISGTRPGGAVAAAWATIRFLGREGYTDIASRIMAIRKRYTDGIQSVGDFQIVGQPQLAVFAFTSQAINMRTVAEELQRRNWYVSRISEPPGIHHMINRTHESAVEDYLVDLGEAAKRTSEAPDEFLDDVVTY